MTPTARAMLYSAFLGAIIVIAVALRFSLPKFGPK
jgi:hypothetical protein